MTRKRILTTVFVGLSLSAAAGARGEFVPGHIFVVQRTDTFCLHQPQNGPDKIWEIDPLTGDVSLFVELPVCVHLTSLVFTPDGTRLRGAALMPNQILEFDSEGNISVALDAGDGISAPEGGNNMAYDADGNFYVTNVTTATLMRFPSEGGPGAVIADWSDGIRGWTAMGFAADGDLYLCPGGDGGVGSDRLLRFAAPDWDVSVFDAYPDDAGPWALAADRSGFVYVRRSGIGFNDLARYRAGDSGSVEILVPLLLGAVRLTMSPDQTRVYVHNAYTGGTRVLAIDVCDGNVTVVAQVSEQAFGGGIAVVPFRAAAGDFDLDGDVDLDDFAAFDACVTGPCGLMEPGCGLGDLDRDVDVDLADLGLLQLSFTGR